MRVFVAGATGRVAAELLKRLVEKGHTVIAGARRPDKITASNSIKPVALDLRASVADLEQVLKGADAVVFTAGSRGKDLLQTDAFGAVKLMQASHNLGIQRFVMLSALYSLEPEKWTEPPMSHILDYQIAKYFADNYLIHQSQLDYTIVQPGPLLDEAGKGTVALDEAGIHAIAIPDVAAVLAEVLEQPNTVGRVISIHPGDTAISEAFAGK